MTANTVSPPIVGPYNRVTISRLQDKKYPKWELRCVRVSCRGDTFIDTHIVGRAHTTIPEAIAAADGILGVNIDWDITHAYHPEYPRVVAKGVKA